MTNAYSPAICIWGPRHGPQTPPSFGPPRRSRGAPLFPWGPRHGPQTPHRSGRPGGAGAPLYFTLTTGGPDMAPKPPIVRAAPAEPGRPPISLGAPTWPPNPLL